MRPDAPPEVDLPTGGVRPDLPEKKPKTIEQRVIGVIAKQLKVDEASITPKKKPLAKVSLVDDLGAKPAGLLRVKKALEKEFRLKIPGSAFKKLHTAGETVDYVKKAVEQREAAARAKQAADAKAARQQSAPPAMMAGISAQ